MPGNYASAVLLCPPYSQLTYSLPDFLPASIWQVGQRVCVPLGAASRLVPAYIGGLSSSCDFEDASRCKEVCWPLEIAPLLGAELVELARDLAIRQGVQPGVVYGHLLPAGLRGTDLQLCSDTGRYSLRSLSGLQPAIRLQLAEEFVAGKAVFRQKKTRDPQERYALKADPPWPVRPGARRQIAILDFLYEHGAVSRRFLASAIEDAATPLRALLRAGLVELVPDSRGDECAAGCKNDVIDLNPRQLAAIADFEAAAASGQAQARLLHGITGSGKTAVYVETARKLAGNNKSVIVLAPEVALAQKLWRELRQSLPELSVIFYHGYQSPPRRGQLWLRAAGLTGPAVVVGTRSALFLPLRNVGCIILDEEHDASYKQDENFSYHAKEVAWWRCRWHKALMVLGSATPDIRTFYASRSGKLPALSLPKRAAGGALPQVELVDPGYRGAGGPDQRLLAGPIEDALRDCLRRDEQAVVLLNRRGYAPMIFCLDCAKTLRCPDCEIGLAYHKGHNRLLCHYCGYSVPYPSPCPKCGYMNFLPLGEGTEKLEERLELLAGRPVLRLDRDIARRPERMEEILGAFARQESPFLVGTQMLSKGHHFPNVTLTVVADGDIGLNLPDYRATERTFQLLVQAAGRAGRGQKPGRVLIQTRSMDHYCWDFVRAHDYEGFYEEEIARRSRHNYPPFTNLGLLRLSFEQSRNEGYAVISELAGILKTRARELDVRLLGPAPAPIGMLRGRRRLHCLLKGHDWGAMRQLYFTALRHNRGRVLRITLDLDPVDML